MNNLLQKYRPMKIADLVGQQRVQSILKGMLRKPKLSHQSFCLIGPTGTGKTTTASIIAAYLTCLKPVLRGDQIVEACGACNPCRAAFEKIKQFQPAVIFHKCPGGGGIDSIRALVREFDFPAQFGYRIYVLDEADSLAEEAQKYLLDVLDDLPGHIVICFCTNNPGGLRVDLQHRCVRLIFDDLRKSQKDLRDYLAKICAKEGWQDMANDQGVLNDIVLSGIGSMREALIDLEIVSAQRRNGDCYLE